MALQGTQPYKSLVGMVTPGAEVSGSGTGSAGGAFTASLAAAVGKTNFVTHVIVTSREVSSVVGGAITITGLLGGTLTFEFVETVSAGGWLDIWFLPPMPASASNTAITINVPAITNGADAAANILGFQV